MTKEVDFIIFINFGIVLEEYFKVKTTIPKADPENRKWFVMDAEDQILGRLASNIAYILRGKHKPEFTPHLDMGDHIVVINADKMKFTGNKESQKVYTRYSGYPGGLKSFTLQKVFKSRPERVLHHAVKGMLPKNRLGRAMIVKLKIYNGPEHPHHAQKPAILPESLRRS